MDSVEVEGRRQWTGDSGPDTRQLGRGLEGPGVTEPAAIGAVEVTDRRGDRCSERSRGFVELGRAGAVQGGDSGEQGGDRASAVLGRSGFMGASAGHTARLCAVTSLPAPGLASSPSSEVRRYSRCDPVGTDPGAGGQVGAPGLSVRGRSGVCVPVAGGARVGVVVVCDYRPFCTADAR